MRLSISSTTFYSLISLLCPCPDIASAAEMEKKPDYSLLGLEEIIVTGTTSSTRTKLESSVAITTADYTKIEREAPLGTADLLELVPGFYVEDSGGEISNNVAPRGLGGGAAFSFISLNEDGLPAIYDGFFNDLLVRQDVTIERMEVVRGGTSGILTVNGAGALVNFISRKGTDEPEGLAKLTLSDYGTIREDIFYGGPISADWNIGIGGYYRTSDGPREPGYTADHGGQLRVNLTRKLDNGELTFHFKKVDEHNTFLLPIPLRGSGNPKSIPGFDANYGTMMSNDNSLLQPRRPDGSFASHDMRDGASTDATVAGFSLDLELEGGWSLSNKARYTHMQNEFTALFNGGNDSLVSGESRLAEADVTDMINRFENELGINVSAEFRYATSGEPITDINALNGNGLVAHAITDHTPSDRKQFANDFRITHESDNNSLSFGAMMITTTMSISEDADTFITEVKDNPSRLDIVAVDDAGNAVGYLTEGSFLRYNNWWYNATGDLKSISLYINDEYQVNDKLRIDAGLRFEKAKYSFSVEDSDGGGTFNGALDANGNDVDNIISNNTYQNFGSGIFVPTNDEVDATAFTVGFNYTFTNTLAIYGRFSDAFNMPGLFGPAEPGDVGDVSELSFGELGVRYSGDTLGFSATLYKTLFENLNFTETDNTTGVERDVFVETQATGIELEAAWQPTEFFSLELVGVIQDASVEGIASSAAEAHLNGNQVTRTPEIQMRLIPTYHFGNGEAFLSIHYLGERFSDLENQLELPAYTTVDAGVRFDVTDSVSLQLKGTNLTNEIGLTEGNPRSGFNQAAISDVYYARPIIGRTWVGSISYKF